MRNKLNKVQQGFIYCALMLVCLFFLLPLFWILRTSLITKLEAYKIPPNWAAPPTLENYISIFRSNPFGRYFFNSFAIAFLSTMIAILLGAMAAYWIARRPGGSPRIKVAILATQMIPPVVMVIPLSLIVKRLGLDDTWFALIAAYFTFNLPYVVWIMISFFESVPRELDEACEIDGCTVLQGYFQVILPLAVPGLAATAIYSFIVAWNEFMFALNMTGLKSRTIPVAIANLETQQGVMIAELCASTVVAILPVAFLAIVIKKYLVNGLTFGSIK